MPAKTRDELREDFIEFLVEVCDNAGMSEPDRISVVADIDALLAAERGVERGRCVSVAESCAVGVHGPYEIAQRIRDQPL